MSSVILPYEMQVEAICYHHRAFALGIIKPNIRQYEQWLCNKFINCIATTSFDLEEYDVWMIKDRLSIKVGGNMVYEAFQAFCPDIIEKNKEMLKQGFYIWGTYDEFCIPGKSAYQYKSFLHNYLIYGYDDQQGVFKSAGYLPDRHYRKFDIKYEDYYRSVTYGDEPRQLALNYYRINRDYEGWIDIESIRKTAIDYLQSRGPENSKVNEVFGVSAWKRFESYIDGVSGNKIDMRYVRAYMEHKGIMDKRLKCLCKHGYLWDQSLCTSYSQNVLIKATQLFYMCLKYSLTGDAELHKRMTALVREINATEQGLIERVVGLL